MYDLQCCNVRDAYKDVRSFIAECYKNRRVVFMSKRSVISASTGFGLILAIFLTACGTEPRGAMLFRTNRCIECHTIKGKGGSAGPNLTSVGQRRSRDYIIQHIKNPASHNPNTAMPSFSGLPEADITDLANYLSRLK